MVLATEIMLPPRRNSFSGSDSEKNKSSTNKSHWWFFTSKLSQEKVGGSNQHIATQKLRESKWFKENEQNIVCSVMESGFIVEIKLESMQDNNTEPTQSHYGIISVEQKKKDKKPSAKDIYVYTVTKCENKYKIVKLSIVDDLWKDNYVLRIWNINDKTKHINSEKYIKNQISYAIKHKTNFHNSLHFVDHCRYGAQLEERKKLVSESVKWGGVSAGIFMLSRERANSYSK